MKDFQGRDITLDQESPTTLKVLNEYPGSHHYWDTYDKTEYFCPNCGAKALWVSRSEDYYAGGNCVCTSCFYKSLREIGMKEINTENMLEIVKQLKTGITYQPTTKKGG